MTSRRPWWKKKRWRTVIALWVSFAYPLSLGPWAYADARGWWPVQINPVLGVIYAPLSVADRWEPWGRAMNRYVNWCYALGRRHAVSD